MQRTFIKLIQELSFMLKEIPLPHYSKTAVVKTKQNLILGNTVRKEAIKAFSKTNTPQSVCATAVRSIQEWPALSPGKESTALISEESHLPAMACTATRRNPRTSPFSLTMATLWIRGTGYSRLLK